MQNIIAILLFFPVSILSMSALILMVKVGEFFYRLFVSLEYGFQYDGNFFSKFISEIVMGNIVDSLCVAGGILLAAKFFQHLKSIYSLKYSVFLSLAVSCMIFLILALFVIAVHFKAVLNRKIAINNCDFDFYIFICDFNEFYWNKL